MRAYIFPLIFLALEFLILAHPYTGVLIWAWISFMNPHQLAGGWISTFPLNSLTVAVLVAALLLKSENPLPSPDPIMLLLLVFAGWCMITTVFALSPATTAFRADISFKNMLFAAIVAGMTRNPVRLRAMVWVFVLCFGYFGVKGGGFTLVTGGAGNVIGPAGAAIEDRNVLALVMLMTIPLAGYLRATSASSITRTGLLVLILLTSVAVLGTYSRGALVGLVFLGLNAWWKSSRKIAFALIAACTMAAGLSVLPDRWFDRMNTIQDANSDESFEGRVDAWHFAVNAASQRLTGVGFSGTEDATVFARYMPDGAVTVGRGRAAHSIYFQVLGDHGYIGLILFLSILYACWTMCGRLARSNADRQWIAELAKSIQLSIIVYCFSGAALSVAYDSSILCLVGLVSALKRLASRPSVVVPTGGDRAPSGA